MCLKCLEVFLARANSALLHSEGHGRKESALVLIELVHRTEQGAFDGRWRDLGLVSKTASIDVVEFYPTGEEAIGDERMASRVFECCRKEGDVDRRVESFGECSAELVV